jgi:hypothetical protein
LSLRNFAAVLALVFSLVTLGAHAQAGSAASRTLELSGFGGLTGTYTGIEGGRNLSLTAGVDIGFRSFHGWRPFAEFRGTVPMDGGHIDSQKDVLGGIRVQKHVLLPGLNVYGDLLLGRGQINYEDGGFLSPSGTFLYISSISTVLSPGAGLQYRLTDHFSVLADAQLQHWDTPVTPSGSLWAKPLTLGVRYTFNFNHRGYAVK